MSPDPFGDIPLEAPAADVGAAPIGLQAAAQAMESGAPLPGAPAAAAPAAIDYHAVTGVTIKAIGSLLGKLGPELAFDQNECDALTTVWEPVVREKLPQASPMAAAVVVSGAVLLPKFGELVVRKRAEAAKAEQESAAAAPRAAAA